MSEPKPAPADWKDEFRDNATPSRRVIIEECGGSFTIFVEPDTLVAVGLGLDEGIATAVLAIANARQAPPYLRPAADQRAANERWARREEATK